MLKCFFFDRDGVLIKNYGYVHEIKKLKWLKGTIEAIKFLNKNKIKVIVITNQSGIARGYFSEKKLLIFHNKMNKILFKFKAKIDDFYYCPYHPFGKVKKYKKRTNLRKPGNGMLLQAIKKYKLEPSNCFMIGDERKDFLSSKKTKINFQFKKNYSLDKQVKKIVHRTNGL
jgi:D,D-heptose 1,7-bisphosphate phosphatase